MTGFVGVVEDVRRATVARRGARLALRDRHRCDLCPLHAQEMDEVAVCVDDSDVHFPIALLCLGFGSRQDLLCFFRTDGGAVWNVERHGIRRPTRRRICRRRLLRDCLAANKQRERKRRGNRYDPEHETLPIFDAVEDYRRRASKCQRCKKILETARTGFNSITGVGQPGIGEGCVLMPDASSAAGHSGLAPEALTTLLHLSTSCMRSSPNSAGEPGSTVPPRSARCALTLASERAALICSLRM